MRKTGHVIALVSFVLLLAFMPAHAFGPGWAMDDAVKVIVIDPGHGGVDSGAVGPDGVAEKDITLGLAKRLAEKLTDAGYAVLLTRTDDTFVPLEERTAFANRHKADIFVSVHANAAISRDANGIETFFLNVDATDDDARRVAAFENSVAADKTGEDVNDDVREILLDLAKTESHHESSMLAESVHTSMLSATGKENRGVKQAPFVVLAGATMPAVLVEVGFISNPREEKWLSSKKDQSRIADSIIEGIIRFGKISGKGKDYIGFNKTHQKD